MKFRLINANIFPLPNGRGILHLGTIEYGFQEFIVMLHPTQGKVYIEEVVLNTVDFTKDVWANCKHIKDDNLFADLAAFVQMHKLTDMKKIAETLIDQGKLEWLTIGLQN